MRYIPRHVKSGILKSAVGAARGRETSEREREREREPESGRERERERGREGVREREHRSLAAVSAHSSGQPLDTPRTRLCVPVVFAYQCYLSLVSATCVGTYQDMLIVKRPRVKRPPVKKAPVKDE